MYAFVNDTATITTTEYSFARDANYAAGTPAVDVNGEIEYTFDLSALVAGDSYRFRVYRHINAVQKIVWESVEEGGQAKALTIKFLAVDTGGYDVTGIKLTGTDRAIAWNKCNKTDPTTRDANVVTWLGVAPNALASGRVDGTVGAMQANVLTASAINAAAITSGKFAAGAIDAAAIAADAIGASELAADAITEITDAILAKAYEGSTTIQAFLRLGGAVLFGKATGLEGASMVFRDFADTKDRVVATYAAGARTPTTRDAT